MNMQTVTFDVDLYKLVPIEPTEEMLEHIWKSSQINEETSSAYEGIIKQDAAIDYKAMLAVSPPINTED